MHQQIYPDADDTESHSGSGERGQGHAVTNYSLVKHWRKLKGKIRLNGKGVYVHPDDMEVLRDHPNRFNLDYPPPAYVGDIVSAPAIMLLTNGGYNSEGTKNEFSKRGAAKRYLDCLHDPSLMCPKGYSPYYLKWNYKEFLRDGHLAIVNVAAYRSPDFSGARQEIAGKLPSVQRHRQWLREELLPAAEKGERFVVAHRYTHWKLDPERDGQRNLYFSGSKRLAHMETAAMEQVEKFLTSR